MKDPPLPLTEDERTELIAAARRCRASSVVVETGTGITPTPEELGEYVVAHAAYMALLGKLTDKYCR